MTTKNERLYDVDRLKGIAIFLVVLGHIVARGVLPEGADWFFLLKEYIYKFHMPLFMFTSGVIFFYTYEKHKPTSIRSYWRYSAKKFYRLMPAYFVFGMIIIIGKIVASNVMHVDDVQYDIIKAISDFLVIPARSPAGSLWYIYVLLQMYLLAPILLKCVDGKYYILVIISIILHFIPATPYFMIDRLFEYSLYFSLGIIAANNYSSYTAVINKFWYVFITIFLASFLTIDYISGANSKLIIGLLSIPAIHAIIFSRYLNNSNLLLILAKYTFAIYLMNTIVIGLVKGILFKYMSWDGGNFIIFFIVLSATGVLVPIFVKKYFFKYFNSLDRITN